MNWLDRVRRASCRLEVGGGIVDLLAWNYAPELNDNVPHRHTFFEVCQVGSHGAASFIVEGHKHRVAPGDVFFARPGVMHQIVNTERRNMELFWVCWAWNPGRDRGEIAELMAQFASSSHVATPGDTRVAAAWTALRTIAEGPLLPGSEAQLASLMTTLILCIAQSGAPTARLEETALPPAADASAFLARAAVRYVSDNLDGRLSVGDIAAHVHVSPRHLSRLFERFTGVSPAAYVERARMDRAAVLLKQSSGSIKTIAASVGYSDVHHFTRRFTLCFGRAPGLFRSCGEAHVPNIQKHGDLV